MSRTSKDETESKILVQARERLYQRLQITYEMTKKLPEKEDIFKERAIKTQSDLTEFENIQLNLSRLNAAFPDESQIEIAQVTTAYEELYFIIQAKLTSLRQVRNDAAVRPADNLPVNAGTSLTPKLTRIQIPKFKGDMDKFPSFRALFDSLVHETDLPDIQKFAQLKTSLEYPALYVLDQFDFTPENYEAAYKKLIARYTNKRIVGTHILDKLLHFKPFSSGSFHNLRHFSDTFCVQYQSLKALKIKDLADFIILTIALKTLDPETKREFEVEYTDKLFPTFDDLANFIEERSNIASLVQRSSKPTVSASSFHNKPSGTKSSKPPDRSVTKAFIAKSQAVVHSKVENKDDKEGEAHTENCPVCKLEHRIYLCPDFLAMSLNNRHDIVKRLRLCFGCLGKHRRSACKSKSRCRKCNTRAHHTFLHSDSTPEPGSGTFSDHDQTSSSSPHNTVGVPENSVNALNCRTQQIRRKSNTSMGLLGTAKGRILTANGEWAPCRMVIDPASESSFITEELAQSLKLKRKPFPVDIVGIGDSRFSNHRGCVQCQIASMHDSQPTLKLEAIVLRSISGHLPKVPLPPQIRSRFQHLRLADPEFDKPGRIDLLLGVQQFSAILGESMKHIPGEPAAIQSIFGFVIFGKVPTINENPSILSFLTHTPTIDALLQRFWEMEEIKTSKPVDPLDQECETLFVRTTKRDELGRYEVSLPFRESRYPENLGSTRSIAKKRLISLERRLQRNPALRDAYNANLQDYVTQGHMRQAPHSSEYVMTHHAVLRDSTSTKVRVVFNASEKSDTSLSLNDCLLTGPKLQTDIADILLKFRLYPISLSADITQMFRCIRINPQDARFTHLLWRADYSSPIYEWEITTLPFGLTCSPYLAQRVIRQLVTDEGKSFPLASEALTSNIYVDDIVCSVSSDEEAISLYKQLEELLKLGGFKLHKVSSNSSLVLSQISTPSREALVSFDRADYVKLLGLKWDPKSDVFRYVVNSDSLVATKRGILSQVARIFDVMGYLAPLTFWIKYFIQRLWILGVSWDEELPDEYTQAWRSFHSELEIVAEVQIPRSLHISQQGSYMVVGFSDASEKGYAACLYLVDRTNEFNPKTRLLKAKSKVSPLKSLTIPRLELEGAALLSSLVYSVNSFLQYIPSYRLFCFTDSSVVLAWLRTPPHQLRTFVANRVIRVLEVIPPDSWFHVNGTINPADCASRGLNPRSLLKHQLWWNGPEFLHAPLSEWPISREINIETIPELKPQTVSFISPGDPLSPSEDLFELLLDKFSSFSKIIRILSYVRRFCHNIRSHKRDRCSGVLTQSEMNQSLEVLVHDSQRKSYPEIFLDLEKGRPIKGLMRYLTPFVSPRGLLRVGGRLEQSPLHDAEKHPLLISKKSKLAKLLCTYYHQTTLHGGPQLVQSLIQRKFWIPGIRSLLRSILFKCMTCYRFKATPIQPFMSSLPSLRFQTIRAFINTGVDLAGPYMVKESKRRNARSNKSWIVLFICMSTRAVHLDLVEDISTPTFLAALDRFVARRGIPARILSDLGTNFVGAARQLKELVNAFQDAETKIQEYCEERTIEWVFNPPAAPHFGGSWEAAVKSMKYHLQRVVGNLVLTQSEFLTLLAKVESILNSRPLSSLSSNPHDGFDYLTPGHFLVGAPMVLSRPEQDFLAQPISYNARWNLLSRCAQDLWKRWSKEYLHTLMQRTKWQCRTANITPGTMVILIDSALPPNLWKLGRIQEVFPGPDGIVRVVTIRTPTGTITRPLTKVCLLPMDIDLQTPTDLSRD